MIPILLQAAAIPGWLLWVGIAIGALVMLAKAAPRLMEMWKGLEDNMSR